MLQQDEYENNFSNLHVALSMLWMIKFHTSLLHLDSSVNWLATGGSESLENIIGLEFKVLPELDFVLVLLSKYS